MFFYDIDYKELYLALDAQMCQCTHRLSNKALCLHPYAPRFMQHRHKRSEDFARYDTDLRH